MAFVVIVGLVVAVIALLITNNQLSRTIKNYEEPTKKAVRSRKNGTNKK